MSVPFGPAAKNAGVELPYRRGSGTVIINHDGLVAWFQRAGDPESWQFQQGGCDPGEDHGLALWRELREETGLTPEDFSPVLRYPGLLQYDFPLEVREDLKRRNRDYPGQIHQWFFLRLKPGVKIDLTKATDREFTAVRFVTFEEALQEVEARTTPVGRMKLSVYWELYEFFRARVAPA